MAQLPDFIRVVDSHTGGEPTRVIVENGPDLGSGDLVARRARFKAEFDHFRSAVINEPRGSDVVVGALPVPPHDPSCSVGVIFFNNVGYLGMCGHGTIGLMVTLLDQGRIALGEQWIETPVGKIRVVVHDRHRVTVENVPSYRYRTRVPLQIPGYGEITGDIAWGGNWFFLVNDHGEDVVFGNLERLSQLAKQIRQTLDNTGVTGADGGVIDHIELFGSGDAIGCDSQNFVLCPGGAYDRSPCGTGTSAKLACLAADGKLSPGQVWRQGSIVGSVFEASYAELDDKVIPSIQGSAYLCGYSELRFDSADPFYLGIH